MKKRLLHALLTCLLTFVLTACAAPAAAPVPTSAPLPTAIPATLTPLPATRTPSPAPSATPALYLPPAERYLPTAAELGGDYTPGDNLLLNNLAILAELPAPRENIAAASFSYNGARDIMTVPQDNMYYSHVFAVIVAPDEASASLFYALSQGGDYRSQAFLVIMPATVHQQMGKIEDIPARETVCDQLSISAVNADIYASYRDGRIPTLSPLAEELGAFSPEKMANLPPEMYIYAACRVRNVLALYWGYTPNNYDGENNPIPPEVIAGQVEGRLRLVTGKLK